MTKAWPAAALLAYAWAVAGCTVPAAPPKAAPPPALAAASFADIPGWQADALAEALPPLRTECRRLALLPVDTPLGGEGLAAAYGGRAGQWSDACAAALAAAPDTDLRAFMTQWFQPYRITAPALFTGYYEPLVRGALARGGIYQVPVLARPSDLVLTPPAGGDPNGRPAISRRAGDTAQPYWTRAEIEHGAIGAAARPLVWLASPIDLFFLQIQGAGRVTLPDGGMVRLAFDVRNGRPYTPIGRILVQQNALAAGDVSMQSIRAWLEAHPVDAAGVMDRNESYVFFRSVQGSDPDQGPPGALGVDLTAGRSAAVDRHFVPLAAPVFIDTTDPMAHTPWRHLVLAQDLGTAIAGPARVDLFLGAGPAAEALAGRLHESGTAYLLLPRPQARPGG